MFKKIAIAFIAMLMIVIAGASPSSAKLADGIYTVPYQMNTAGSVNPSIANDYFVKPAKLIVEKGVHTVEVTITNSSWITELTPPGYKKISEDTTADTRTFQFTVADTSKIVEVPMRVEIPSLDYYHSYIVDFDLDDAKATKTGDVGTATANPTATSTTKPTTSMSTTTAVAAANTAQAQQTKPATTTATNTTVNKTQQATATQVKNPQTSDNLPYVAVAFLLLSAFVMVRLRKQGA